MGKLSIFCGNGEQVISIYAAQKRRWRFNYICQEKLFFADTSSPTQQQLEDSPQIVLTFPHNWDPHSVRFPKVSHSEDEKDLFSGIVAIPLDALMNKVHDTEIEPGLHNTVHNPYFIVMRLVSQVRIVDAKDPDTTRITDLDENVFKGRLQSLTSHRTFMSKEIH